MVNTKLYDEFIDVLNSKEIRSCFSQELIHFYSDYDEAMNSGHKVTSDGYWLWDDICDVEDDFSQMYAQLDDDSFVNLQDYWEAFMDDTEEGFKSCIENMRNEFKDRG